jgi:sphinganine-1-phosphate aldolase
METTKQIADGVRAMHGVHLLGLAEAMIVCFGSRDYSIYKIVRLSLLTLHIAHSTCVAHATMNQGDVLSSKGWALNSLQHPASIHLCVTVRHVGRAQQLLDDLRAAIDTVRQVRREICIALDMM